MIHKFFYGSVVLLTTFSLAFAESPRYVIRKFMGEVRHVSLPDDEIPSANAAPMFDTAPWTIVDTGAIYSYEISASDADVGDAITLTAPTKPAWLSFASTGSGTATLQGSTATPGTHDVSLKVSDGHGGEATQNFTIRVNALPYFTSAPVTASQEMGGYTYPVVASDDDITDTLAFSATTAPAWITLVDNGDRTALLSGSAPMNGLENIPPSFTSTPAAAVTSRTEGQFTQYDITVTDTNKVDMVQVTSTTLPSWLTLVWNGNQLRTAKLYGTAPLLSSVTPEANAAPSFTSTAITSGTQNVPYTYNIAFSDTNKVDMVMLSAPTLPAWLTLSDNGNQLRTGKITGTAPAEAGTHNITLRVTDSVGAITEQSFTITIL